MGTAGRQQDSPPPITLKAAKAGDRIARDLGLKGMAAPFRWVRVRSGPAIVLYPAVVGPLVHQATSKNLEPIQARLCATGKSRSCLRSATSSINDRPSSNVSGLVAPSPLALDNR
jgi:hypothetical protein